MESRNGILLHKRHPSRKTAAGTQKLENTEIYLHLINFESDEWHVAHAKNLEEKSKLKARFEYVNYSQKNDVAINIGNANEKSSIIRAPVV